MAALATPEQVTYGEIRMWARWLGMFTASDLADAMGVDHEVGLKGIRALLWHGLVSETGDELDGYYGAEAIVEYNDPRLLPGPTQHPVGRLPEHIAVSEMGGWLLYDRRGLPVRLLDNTSRRNLAQQAGSGNRLRMKLRDARFEAHQQAQLDRAEKDRQRRIKREQEGKKRWE